MVEPNKYPLQNPVDDWLRVEAKGDVFLYRLLLDREDVGNHKGDYDLDNFQNRMDQSSQAITRRLAELGMTGWEWQGLD